MLARLGRIITAMFTLRASTSNGGASDSNHRIDDPRVAGRLNLSRVLAGAGRILSTSNWQRQWLLDTIVEAARIDYLRAQKGTRLGVVWQRGAYGRILAKQIAQSR